MEIILKLVSLKVRALLQVPWVLRVPSGAFSGAMLTDLPPELEGPGALSRVTPCLVSSGSCSPGLGRLCSSFRWPGSFLFIIKTKKPVCCGHL